jgi:hypothetical protein
MLYRKEIERQMHLTCLSISKQNQLQAQTSRRSKREKKNPKRGMRMRIERNTLCEKVYEDRVKRNG